MTVAYTPKIRFQGFADEWEQRKLSELSDTFEYGLNAAAKEFDGENKYIRITDIDDVSHEFNGDDVTSPDTDLANAENYKLADGDILFARTGASVGKTYIYKESDGVVYYAGFLIRARIKKEYNPEFVFQNTLTADYEKYIAVTSQRSGQPGVNAQEYSEYKIMISGKAEQDKVSAYLGSLDYLITLHQHKCDETKEMKKYMLQKMFPRKGKKNPEIRFAGFTGDWEQRKLSELIEEYKEVVESNCELPVLTSSKTEGVLLQEEHFGRKQSHDITGYNVLPRNYCTYRNRSDGIDFTFNINKCCERGIISKFYPVFCGKDSDTFFISLVLNNSDEVVREIGYTCTGTGQKVLNFSDLLKMYLNVPTHEEQKKIAAYFDRIDSLITLHQRKCNELKEVKKFMLQNMFPQKG